MPTSGRVIYDGAICHIVQRGNNKQKIFQDEEDYKKFQRLMRDYKSKYAFEIFNYCLMPNHIHLLIRIGKKQHLSKLAQGIFQSYRFYYKRKYDYAGNLYQGRYRSSIIEKESYLLECARYIERNPLRANIVVDLACYKWSSYNYYAYTERNEIIAENPMYSTFGCDSIKRQEIYREYVVAARPYEIIVDEKFDII